MCGRFALTIHPRVLARLFQISDDFFLEQRYNIAPGQTIPAIRQSAPSQVNSPRHLAMLRWGLIPHWAQDETISYKLINARSETAAQKPSFRDAFKSRRCLIPADGFYEWKKNGKIRQPYYFSLRDNPPLAMAGLWERWQSPENTTIESCTLLTTAANELMQPIHGRMPVIISPPDFDQWLAPDITIHQELEHLLKPYPSDKMHSHPVSTIVNSPKNDSPECLKAIILEEPGLFDLE